MSIQRACRFCGRRLRGTMPGAMTIMLDGQPFDAAIALCSEHTIDVRRVLDAMARRSVVAQQAREVDVTTRLRPVGDAMTEHFGSVPRDAPAFRRESLGEWPVDAQVAVPLPHRRRTTFGGWRRGAKPY